MSTPIDLVRRYWERCWNERAVDELGEIFYEPYQHNRSEGTIAEHAAIIEDTVRAFPDVRVEIVDIATSGDAVISRARFTLWHLTDHLPMLRDIGAEVRVASQLADLD